MAVPMTVVEDIRRLDSQGVSGRDIARRLNVSRDSVAKYTSIEDFSPTPPTMKRPGSKVLDGLEVVLLQTRVFVENGGSGTSVALHTNK